jgi:precorrin-2/cobalt-factor-2 C20-methyltransferase
MGHDRTLAQAAYRSGAEAIREHLHAGRRVVVLCQGDPLFYGTFIHLREAVGEGFPCRVIPGITSPSSAAAAALRPVSRLSERVAVINARETDERIVATLREFDGVAILKAGPSRLRLLGLIRQAGRWHETAYLAHVGTAEELVIHDLDRCPATAGPYFSLFLTTRSNP